MVGLPNAGKSTFLAAVSAAKPKIADYPFTTLHPNLGVVKVGERDFVLADIPGLIEGAHEGAGIGDRFLGHVERTGVLIHLIDGTQDDVKSAYTIIRGELAAYDEALAEKPEIVVLNKIDALTDDEIKDKVKVLKRASKAEVMHVLGRHRARVFATCCSAVISDRSMPRRPRAHRDWRARGGQSRRLVARDEQTRSPPIGG